MELSNRKPSLLKRRKRHKTMAVLSGPYGKLAVMITEAMLQQLLEGKTIISWCKLNLENARMKKRMRQACRARAATQSPLA